MSPSDRDRLVVPIDVQGMAEVKKIAADLSRADVVIDELRCHIDDLSDDLAATRRDLTACRAELASLAIWLQDRDQLPDPGGDNFALVAGVAQTYMLSMELAVVALNEDRKDLLFDVEYFRKTIVMLWDLMPLDLCIRFSGISPARYQTANRLWSEWDAEQKAGRYTELSHVTDDDCDPDCDDDHHAPMCPRWEGHPAANCGPTTESDEIGPSGVTS